MKTSSIRAILNTVLSIAILLGLVLLYLTQPVFLRWADLRIYDTLLAYNIDKNPSPALAIIDIDEKSLDAYGQWPWPRYRIAQLVKIVTESQAVAIGLDILQAEPDQSSPATLQKNFKDTFKLDITFDNIPKFLQDNDTLLADIYAQAPVIAAIFLPVDKNTPSKNEYTAKQKSDITFSIQRLEGAIPFKDRLITATDITLPIDAIAKSTPLGYMNVSPDIDGIFRAVPLIMQYNDKIYPSLALRTLMRALNRKNCMLRIGPDGLQSIGVGGYTIPVSPQGLFHILFRGPKKTYPYFSVVDIMEGRVKAEDLRGRIVFIGTSAIGLFDLRATPLDPVYPGVEGHATIVDNILSKRHITMPPWAPGAQIISILITGLICALAFSLAKPAVYIFVSIVLASISLGSAQMLFAAGFFFSPLYSLLTILSLGTGLLMLRIWQIDKQKFVLQKAFSNYVAPEIVSQITEKGGNILQGQSKEVSIIFTDVRGFTTLSEKLQPTQVVSLLNDYLTPMTALILKNKGTVDKFIGDAVMAFWNAPLDVPHHPIKAIQTAIEMMETLEVLNSTLKERYGIELAIGAGLHTGMVHVGNMGSAELLDYTCIGDTVNLCARLESLCSKYGRTIITSEYTKNLCAQVAQDLPEDETLFNFMEIDTITVKGKSEPVKIFTVLSSKEKEDKIEEFATFQEASVLYSRGEFAKAEKIFLQLQQNSPNSKLYTLYHERCVSLAANPPAEWNGVWKFETK